MCTVTLVPVGAGERAGVRIACNRDESVLRAAALPPVARRFGERTALMPVDPSSGGTWIAVNDAGLAMVLLNRNPVPSALRARPAGPSRGTIIPALLHCDNLGDAQRLARDLDTRSMAPFALVLANRAAAWTELTLVDGVLGVQAETKLAGPRMFTSSGLGDELVAEPRRRLFDGWFGDRESWAQQQDAFQCHSWPGLENVSVCMRRPEARTVSLTVVELGATSATMTYFPQAPDEAGTSFTISLPLS